MNAMDVLTVVLRLLAAVGLMVQKGFSREQALTRIRSITADLKGVDTDVDEVLKGIDNGGK
jgi:hypothetical protein